MEFFDQSFVDTLNDQCTGEEIHFVGLGRFNFQVSFGMHHEMSNALKVEFSIGKKTYLWEEGPCDVPAWLLIGQLPISYSLVAPDQLCMKFQSGDAISFFTDEGPYENHIVDFPPDGDTLVMEIF